MDGSPTNSVCLPNASAVEQGRSARYRRSVPDRENTMAQKQYCAAPGCSEVATDGTLCGVHFAEAVALAEADDQYAMHQAQTQPAFQWARSTVAWVITRLARGEKI